MFFIKKTRKFLALRVKYITHQAQQTMPELNFILKRRHRINMMMCQCVIKFYYIHFILLLSNTQLLYTRIE